MSPQNDRPLARDAQSILTDENQRIRDEVLSLRKELKQSQRLLNKAKEKTHHLSVENAKQQKDIQIAQTGRTYSDLGMVLLALCSVLYPSLPAYVAFIVIYYCVIVCAVTLWLCGSRLNSTIFNRKHTES